MTKKTYRLFIVLSALFLSGCDWFSSFNERVAEAPHGPPKLETYVGRKPVPQEVAEFRKQIVEYIRYLEEYYNRIGIKYGDTRPIPIVLSRGSKCQVYEYLFTELVLSDPPPFKYTDVDATIKQLVDYINVMRKDIRTYNEKVREYRNYYQDCFNQIPL